MSVVNLSRSAWALILGATAIAAAATVLVVLAALRSMPQVTPHSGGEVRPAASSITLTSVSIGGESYDIAYDQTSDRLWMAIMRASGPDELVGLNTATEEITRITLPDSDYNGFTSRVIVGSGAVWVTQPYRIIQFDPTSASLQVADLPLEVPDALPGSLDEATLLPGTWVSALAINGDMVLVARNNVPYLLIMDGSLQETGRIPLPANYAGAQDLAVVDGVALWIVSGPTATRQTGEFDLNGKLIAEYSGGGTRLETASGEVVALGFEGGASILSGDGPTSIGTFLGGTDGSRLSADGDAITIYDEPTGAIYLVRAGRVVASISTPESIGEVPRPLGGTANVRIRARVTDIAMDQDGNTWYFDANAQTAVRIAW